MLVLEMCCMLPSVDRAAHVSTAPVLQAFVSQFGLPSTEQHQSERYDASKGDHTATTVPVTFGRGLQRGTADTLVQAARTHLLHRSGPATAHPHAHLLHQSFELLEGRGAHVEECPSFAKERVASPTAAPCQQVRPLLLSVRS